MGSDTDRPFRPTVHEEEAGVETSLRPASFREFVGQRRVTENLLISIEAARERGDVLDHVLLSGPPGLGKTTLAYLVAEALGVGVQTTSGPVLEHGRDLLGVLTCLSRGDVLFIDEVHRMSSEAEEFLYSAMEDFRVDIIVDKGPEARTYPLAVQPFTLVAATTREGLLSAPFRGRFGIQEKLEPYSPDEIATIVGRSAGILGVEIEEEAAMTLARRARGTPRYANRFLRRVRDVAQFRQRRRNGSGVTSAVDRASVRIGTGAVEEALERLGVDVHGLDRTDRKILDLLLANGERPVGLKTISVSVGEEDRTIEDVYEPYLLQRGLIVKTPRGRLATQRAVELLSRSLV